MFPRDAECDMGTMMAEITAVKRNQVPRCSFGPLLFPLSIRATYTGTADLRGLNSHIPFSYIHTEFVETLAQVFHRGIEPLC